VLAAGPRQLQDTEIVALLTAATDDARLVMLALLSGLNTEEIAALCWDQIDFTEHVIRAADSNPRILLLEEPLRGLLDARRQHSPTISGTVFHNIGGSRLSIEEVEQLVKYAAHDAALDRPQEVAPGTLRYTWLSFLLRQGIRAADVSRVAGYVPQNDLVTYMALHSPRTRQPLDRIDRVLPVLRRLACDGLG